VIGWNRHGAKLWAPLVKPPPFDLGRDQRRAE
jgi:hypothetical protein